MSSDDIAKSIQKRACKTCSQEFTNSSVVCPHDGTLLTPVIPDRMIGTIVGDRYKILGLAGKGGMGSVYKATHLLMDRVVAIKMLHAHLVSDSHALQRFQQEAKASCNLTHPNIIQVFDFGIAPEGQPYLVMEYLKGISLTEALERQGIMIPERALHIAIQACSALASAHENGVVHRDLKPSNIILTTVGQDHNFVKIVDFGIAKLLPSAGRETMGLTQTGEIFGSPLYMSPEQCMAQKLDNRADIYSLGCVMYELLTGVPPLVGKHSVDTIQKHVNEMPRPLQYANPKLAIPDGLEPIIFKALAKDPKQRYQTMKELEDDLRKIAGSSQPSAAAPAVAPAVAPDRGVANKHESIETPNPPAESPPAAPNRAASTLPEELKETTKHKGPSTFSKVLLAIWIPIILAVLIGGWCAYNGLWFPPLVDPMRLYYWYSGKTEAAFKAGQFSEAEKWGMLAVQAGDKLEEPKLRMTRSLNMLGKIYVLENRPEDAETLIQKALSIRKKADVLETPDGVDIMNTLADLYVKEGKYSFAEDEYNQLLKCLKNMFGPNHPEVTRVQVLLGKTHQKEGEFTEAYDAFMNAVSEIEHSAGPNSKQLIPVLHDCAKVLRDAGRTKEADEAEQRANEVEKKNK